MVRTGSHPDPAVADGGARFGARQLLLQVVAGSHRVGVLRPDPAGFAGMLVVGAVQGWGILSSGGGRCRCGIEVSARGHGCWGGGPR